MRSYLSIGVVVMVKTNCKTSTYLEKIRKEYIYRGMLDLNDYEIVQDKEVYYHFSLKDECFGENLVSFMRTQIELYKNIANNMKPGVLTKLAEIKNFRDLDGKIGSNTNLWPFFLTKFEQYQFKRRYSR